MSKVRIYSSRPNVGITLPNFRFNHTWAKKGAYRDIDEELLQEIMTDPGVEYMFTNGLLYLDKKHEEIGKEAGIFVEGEIYNDAQLKVLLTVKPTTEFEDAMKTMSKASKDEIVEMGKTTELSIDKIKVIKEYTGIDLTSAQNIFRNEKINPFNPNSKEG